MVTLYNNRLRDALPILIHLKNEWQLASKPSSKFLADNAYASCTDEDRRMEHDRIYGNLDLQRLILR